MHHLDVKTVNGRRSQIGKWLFALFFLEILFGFFVPHPHKLWVMVAAPLVFEIGWNIYVRMFTETLFLTTMTAGAVLLGMAGGHRLSHVIGLIGFTLLLSALHHEDHKTKP